MKLEHCPHCDREVPMLDESEYAVIWEVYCLSHEAWRRFNAHNKANIDKTPLNVIFRPVVDVYEDMTGETGLDANHILKHHIIRHGPRCKTCGTRQRTPHSRVCDICGKERT